MLDIIKLLPDSVANQIAAGEVIQRPASAVKELMENALDAGATQIDLVVKDAGKSMIMVIDNGCGMSETDARLCFERHATSKISKAEQRNKLIRRIVLGVFILFVFYFIFCTPVLNNIVGGLMGK